MLRMTKVPLRTICIVGLTLDFGVVLAFDGNFALGVMGCFYNF